MNLLPDTDQQAIASAAAAFLARETPVGRARFDRALWSRMGELGWFSLGLPGEVGGAGYTVVEEAVLFRELGRFLAPGPFLATTLACRAAAAAGELGLLADLAAGRRVAGLAEAHHDPEATVGRAVTGRYRLLDADGADLLLVVAPDGIAVVDASGALERRAFAGLDPATDVALARLAGVAALAVVPNAGDDPHAGGPGGASPGDCGAVLLAALLVGICEATRDQSVAFASKREQFGRPIGSFQAVKHRCADMAVRAEAAASLTFLAALTLRDGESEAARLVPLAKALTSEYALASAGDNIQNHGGMGFTDECTAHLYLKRASILSTVLGSPAELWASTIRRPAPGRA